MRIYAPDTPDLHIYPFWAPVLDAIADAGATAPDCPRTLELLERSIHVDVSPLCDEQDLDEIAFAFEKVASRRAGCCLTVRVGVVGGGLVAQASISPIWPQMRDRFELAAIVDPSGTVCDCTRGSVTTSGDTRTIAELLDAAKLDAVVIARRRRPTPR